MRTFSLLWVRAIGIRVGSALAARRREGHRSCKKLPIGHAVWGETEGDETIGHTARSVDDVWCWAWDRFGASSTVIFSAELQMSQERW